MLSAQEIYLFLTDFTWNFSAVVQLWKIHLPKLKSTLPPVGVVRTFCLVSGQAKMPTTKATLTYPEQKVLFFTPAFFPETELRKCLCHQETPPDSILTHMKQASTESPVWGHTRIPSPETEMTSLECLFIQENMAPHKRDLFSLHYFCPSIECRGVKHEAESIFNQEALG